jgi:hypothetical protein
MLNRSELENKQILELSFLNMKHSANKFFGAFVLQAFKGKPQP